MNIYDRKHFSLQVCLFVHVFLWNLSRLYIFNMTGRGWWGQSPAGGWWPTSIAPSHNAISPADVYIVIIFRSFRCCVRGRGTILSRRVHLYLHAHSAVWLDFMLTNSSMQKMMQLPHVEGGVWFTPQWMHWPAEVQPGCSASSLLSHWMSLSMWTVI